MKTFYDIGKHSDTDKCTHHGYHYFYPRFLEPLRGESFNMLEIGYDNGNSARMWEKYFPYSTIYCMDINKSGDYEGHKVIKGDQSNHNDRENVISIVNNARFILDDGSHHPVHQYETFLHLFKNLLEPGGIYIIEDIECNYWRPDSTIYGYTVGHFDAVKKTFDLVDLINSEFSGKNNELEISTITYGQNCIIITKRTEEESSYFNRDYRFIDSVR